MWTRFVLIVLLLCVPCAATAQSPWGELVGILGAGALRSESAAVAAAAVIGQQADLVPAGSSSGGFTWVFDRRIGLVVRRSASFGPILTERPLTLGRRQFSIGVTTQHTAWRSLAGQDLREGAFASDRYQDDFYSDTLEPVEERSTSVLHLTTDRTIVMATYGMTDRIDVSAIVPFGRTRVSGSSIDSYQQLRFGNYRRFFESSGDTSAAGVGNLAVRAKALLLSRRRVAASVAGELRLPTGSPRKLLGNDDFQQKLSGLLSITAGRFAPHVDIGYVFGGSAVRVGRDANEDDSLIGTASSERTYAGGVDVAISRGVTVAASVVGRTLIDSVRFTRETETFGSVTRERFRATPGDLTIVMGSIGAKAALGPSWLITGSVLFSLHNNGFSPAPTPIIGFERAF